MFSKVRYVFLDGYCPWRKVRTSQWAIRRGRRKPTSACCPLTSIHKPWHMYSHAHTHNMPNNCLNVREGWKMDQQVKALSTQAWWHKFNSQITLKGRRREPTPWSCPLFSIHVQWHVWTHTHIIYSHDKTERNNPIWVSWGRFSVAIAQLAWRTSRQDLQKKAGWS